MVDAVRQWVPKMLTEEHKTNQVHCAQEFLDHYVLEGDELFYSIVTGDETWVPLFSTH